MTSPTPPDIGVGTVLRDTYEVTSLLGRGGMSALYGARHRRFLDKPVVIKVLSPGVPPAPEGRERFRREARIASQLDHPNIVKVLDFDLLPEGTPFLVMELLRGESLEQRLKRGPLASSKALDFTRQIGAALQEAHRAGVVHRHLEPANVFLVPTGFGSAERVKLLDVGISKVLDSQLEKSGEPDARTDLFALGCLVYEMLSGCSPFASVQTPPESLAKRCPLLPGHLVSAVERALAKTPAERFPDVATFLAALDGNARPSSDESLRSEDSFPLDASAPAPVIWRSASAREKAPPVQAAPVHAAPAPVVWQFVPDEESLPPDASAPAPVIWRSPSAQARIEAAGEPAPSTPKALPVRAGNGSKALAVGLVGLLGALWWLLTPHSESVEPDPIHEHPGGEAHDEGRENSYGRQRQAVTDPRGMESTLELPPSNASTPLADEVRILLAHAERELAGGNATEAIRLARFSQRLQITPAAYSVMTRAYCSEGNLSNAAAKWREGQKMMSAREREQARRYCKRYDIEF